MHHIEVYLYADFSFSVCADLLVHNDLPNQFVKCYRIKLRNICVLLKGFPPLSIIEG